jgi:hypothetical protein
MLTIGVQPSASSTSATYGSRGFATSFEVEELAADLFFLAFAAFARFPGPGIASMVKKVLEKGLKGRLAVAGAIWGYLRISTATSG